MKKYILLLVIAFVLFVFPASGEVFTRDELQQSREQLEDSYSEQVIDAALQSGAESFVGMYGLLFDRDAEVIDFGKTEVRKTAKLVEALPQFTHLTEVDMYESSLSRKQMAELHEAAPDIHFGWTLKLGSHVIRTDITAFSSLHGPSDTHYSSDYYSLLQYCWQLEALDLGHNKVSDLTFIGTLTHLKYLILADNQITDITPLSNLHELQYVELFMNKIKDVTPLSGLTELLDVNICYNRLTDISCLYSLPKLERLWISRNRFTDETEAEIAAALPDVQIIFESYGSTSEGWREHERYFIIKETFDNYVFIPFDQNSDSMEAAEK